MCGRDEKRVPLECRGNPPRIAAASLVKETLHKGSTMLQLVPSTIRATVTDRFISAFFSAKCDLTLRMEMRFDHRLDPGLLERAFDLVLDAEPVLGCRFIVENGVAFWQRIDGEPRLKLRTFTEKEPFSDYVARPVDISEGPAVEVGLLRDSSGDTLLMKVAHEAADAAGVKDVAYFAASIYRQLEKHPSFTPAPNLKSYRSARNIFKRVPRPAFPRIWLNACAEMVPLIVNRSSCNPFAVSCDISRPGYSVRTIGRERLSSIKSEGKRRGATINDLFLAAFMWSLSRNSCISDASLRCGMTVDLRRWYLPGGQADTVANLSGIEIVDLGRTQGMTIDTLRDRVAEITGKRKRNWIGLNLHAGLLNIMRPWSHEKMCGFFTRMQERDIRDMALFPVFTNMGCIERDHLVFGRAPVDAREFVPAAFPPCFGIGMSGFDGTLTISSAAFPATVERVDKILEEMLDVLPG